MRSRWKVSGTMTDRTSDLLTLGSTGTGNDLREQDDAAGVENVRVRRQAIYDVDGHLVAYELLFTTGAGIVASLPTPDDHDRPPSDIKRPSTQAISTTLGTFGVDGISDGKPLFIPLTAEFLNGSLPLPPLEPQHVVIVLMQANVDGSDRDVLTGLAALHAAGFRIALDATEAAIDDSPLFHMADFVALNSRDDSTRDADIEALRARHPGRLRFIARNVGDAARYRLCRERGFDLFQGGHLQTPVLLEQRTLTPSQIICARLLNDLADPDASIAAVERLVGSDPGLTLRMLRTANCAAGAAQRAIDSLRQALVLIGPRRLRAWVVLSLLEGGLRRSPTDDLWRVLTRAFCCRRLSPGDPDVANTIGLLSGAAELLGTSMAQLASASGVAGHTRRALVDGEGEAGRALLAVLAHEHDDESGVTSSGLTCFDVSRAYLQSLSESLEIIHDLSTIT